MKKKTINKVITAKFKEWCDSITDESVKQLVKQNTIITGGCIASMLLKESVNDFDIYFRNKETVLAVARYYVAKMLEIMQHENKDGVPVPISVVDCDTNPDEAGIGKEPGRVKILIQSAGIASSDQKNPYRYFESRPQQEAEDYVEDAVRQVSEVDDTAIDESAPKGGKYKPVFLSANAITLSDKVQIVIRFYGEPDNIHQHYDYIHCTNYWTSWEEQLTLIPAAMESLLSRELVYVGSKYPLCSVIRTRKFLKRGWTINAGQYLKMCFQISKLDLENVNVLEDQLIGVDAAYFGQLIDGLQSKVQSAKDSSEQFKLEYGYLATIIDKIF